MCEIRICKFAIQRVKNMNTNKTFQFTAAICGYHVFRKIWEPVIEEELKCAHEVGNEYDVFSIKTCQGSGKTVGHLPREISRATKFLLDRGATVNAKLSSEHYRKSPLFQGGLEIACIITVTMPGTVRNHMVIERYKEIVERLYCKPKNEVVIGCFLENTIGNVTPLAGPSNKKKKTDNKKPPNKKPPPKSRDIRAMFFAQNKKNLADTVVID